MEKSNKYEDKLVQCINDVRQNPASITEDVKFIVDNFDAKNKKFKYKKSNQECTAQEPAALWKQTIDFLKK